MRKIVLLTWMLSLGICSLANDIKVKSPVQVVSTRMNVFYFKIDKALLGANLQVYSEDGAKLTAQILGHRKTLIDFFYEKPGKYIILITKGALGKNSNL